MRQHAQQIKEELEQQQPNIEILHQYKRQLADYNRKEETLREFEHLIREQKEECSRLKKMRHDEFMEGFK